MNDLIAVDGTEIAHQFFASVEDPSTMLGYVPVVGDVVGYAQALGNGDWAGALLSGGAAVVGAVTTAVDPLGTLLSSCAAFLIDYMPPLPQMLDALAGNPALVQSIGETWTNVAGALTERAAELKAAMAQVLSNWRGAAADAYKSRMEFLIGMTTALSAGAMGIGAGFMVASVVVEIVRTITRDIIADLVGRLIAYIIETGATLGLALPVVIGQAVTAITNTVTQAAKWSDDLVSTIETGVEMTEQLKDALGHIQTLIGALNSGNSQAQGAGGG